MLERPRLYTYVLAAVAATAMLLALRVPKQPEPQRIIAVRVDVVPSFHR